MEDEIFFGWNDGVGFIGIGVDKALTGTQFDWHHIVAIYQSGEQQLYLDGGVIGSNTKKDTIKYFNQEVWIGKSPNFDGSFAGMIDEVAIFNVALTEDDIKYIMTEGLGVILAVSEADKLTTTWASIKAK